MRRTGASAGLFAGGAWVVAAHAILLVDQAGWHLSTRLLVPANITIILLPPNRVAAQRWFRAAAELGHGHAQLMLARYLASGAAGEVNPVETRHWLERAAEQGIPEAE